MILNDITLVLVFLLVTVILMASEKLRPDLVALLMMGGLAVTGLLSPADALSGFSNPAVVTVWAMFVLSAGLSQTGIADLISGQVLRMSGNQEARLLWVIMLVAAFLSAFMNNIGVAALLLPVVMSIARSTQNAPSRLLMPLAYGTLLGGLTTLIGTPPNLLASDIMRQHGLTPFRLFDFAGPGIIVTLVGTAYMVVFGRRLLPARDVAQVAATEALAQLYNLQQRLFALRLPASSSLVGRSLAASKLGAILGLNVVGLVRNGRTQLAPPSNIHLEAGDQLLVMGLAEQLHMSLPRLEVTETGLSLEDLVSRTGTVAEIRLPPDSSLVGKSLAQLNFRDRYGINVLAIRRNGIVRRTDLQSVSLETDDTLLVRGTSEKLEDLHQQSDFQLNKTSVFDIYGLHERLFLVRLPADSVLVGRTLIESRLGEAFGLAVLEIMRGGQSIAVPEATHRLEAGDLLLVEGKQEDLVTLEALTELGPGDEPAARLPLESAEVGLMEVVLAPRSGLAGKSLQDLHFREKYGLNVLAIWRGGQILQDGLRHVALRFGDALLLHGARDRLRLLESEPDFLILEAAARVPTKTSKAPLALTIMFVVLLTVLLGWLPISIAAVSGAGLMILTGCLHMEEAYREIDWRAVFLIAGLMPLGVALQESGAARLLADNVAQVIGPLGPIAVLAGLFLITTLATQIMPNAAVTVLMVPIGLSTADQMGVSPYTFVMGIALAASASFLSPVSHPANVLVMGPGGYRLRDYVKVGLPLTLIVLVVALIVLPLLWPFSAAF